MNTHFCFTCSTACDDTCRDCGEAAEEICAACGQILDNCDCEGAE